ncbi:hypothetical protein [Nostoc sp. CHAB 5715]|uniref:hypothetical protein n=1 Tax=Nostoc sp. CHAB 5715 TaxID=2780400 RepID=UPI001E5303DC|nr:hypothetical protein [Nostoc sp. CHAB 5715]MCC5623208.1 hypothetical protein [Nostoc sp. CHAB 5715]
MLEPVRWAGSPTCSNWRAYSRYQTNQSVICINQDVPTYFHAVQQSRLPIVAMLLDRGLSDTNVGQAYHKYFTRKSLLNWRFVAYPFPQRVRVVIGWV